MFVAWKTQVLLAMVIRLEEGEEAWPAREEQRNCIAEVMIQRK